MKATGTLVFMDSETYEQIELPAEILGERRPFLQDGMTIQVEYPRLRGLERDAATEGDVPHRRDGAGGEGPDCGELVQAGDSRQRRARDGTAVRRSRRGHHRQYRDDGIHRARLIASAARASSAHNSKTYATLRDGKENVDRLCDAGRILDAGCRAALRANVAGAFGYVSEFIDNEMCQVKLTAGPDRRVSARLIFRGTSGGSR